MPKPKRKKQPPSSPKNSGNSPSEPQSNEQTPAPAEPPRPDAATAVYNWLIDGHSLPDIADALAKTNPDADQADALKQAWQLLALPTDQDLRATIGLHLARFDRLYRDLISTGDYAGAIKATKESFAVIKWAHEKRLAQPPAEFETLEPIDHDADIDSELV